MVRKRTPSESESPVSTETMPSPSENGHHEEANPPSDTNGSAETPEKSNGRKPVASWKFPVDKGTNLQTALWPNVITLASGEEIEVLSMTISRSYKDKNGEWVNSRTSFSFRVHELPVLMFAIQQAYSHAMNQRQMDVPF